MAILCTGQVLKLHKGDGSPIGGRNWFCTARWIGWKGIDIGIRKFLIALCGATPANIISIQSPLSQNLTYIFEQTCTLFHSTMKSLCTKNMYIFLVTECILYRSFHVKICSKDSIRRIRWQIMNDSSNQKQYFDSCLTQSCESRYLTW